MTLLIDTSMLQINFQLSPEQTADLLKTLKELSFYTPKWSSTSDDVTPTQWVSTLSAERMSQSATPRTSGANRERIQMWYDELMKGHRQAFSQLTDTNGGFCAMGVAWQVYARETGASANPPKEGNAYQLMTEWYGYEGHDPLLLSEALPMTESVIRLNDLYRWSLEQIAEAVRLTFLADEPETAEPETIEPEVTVPDSPAELAEQELVNA